MFEFSLILYKEDLNFATALDVDWQIIDSAVLISFPVPNKSIREELTMLYTIVAIILAVIIMRYFGIL